MCVSKHTNKVSSVVCLEGKCASILWNFTNCVVATVFSSSRPPTLQQCLVCLQGRVPRAT